MKIKKIIKKVNNGNKNISVKTLGCHCGCQGKPVSAAGNGYAGRFL
ncbi:MAG: lachnocin family radical SAM-modified peptide [Lactobacillales bacterium]|jgi:hypothetical protein|nr:lachnocin family radical SAM-modified peptide [Lactobacillales bacterium]